MQLNLIRNTLYRATFQLLIRIVLLLVEDLNKQTLAEIFKWFFTNRSILLASPKELKE